MKILVYNPNYGYCHYSIDYIYKTDWAYTIAGLFTHKYTFYSKGSLKPFEPSKDTKIVCIYNCNSYEEFKEQFPELFI